MSSKPNSRTHAVQQTTKYFKWCALMEGITLSTLLLVAVPIKYLLGEPVLVRAMGPIHGITFLAYIWALMQLQGAAAWPRRRSMIMFLAAFIPFGSYVALSRLRPLHTDAQHSDHRGA